MLLTLQESTSGVKSYIKINTTLLLYNNVYFIVYNMSRTSESIKNLKCIDCPKILHAFADITDADEVASEVSEAVMSIPPEVEREFVEELLKGPISELIRANGINNPDDLQNKMLEDTLKLLETVEDERDITVQFVEQQTQDCEGPMKMRAKRNGQVVTATVCMSPENEQGFGCEDVHLERNSDS